MSSFRGRIEEMQARAAMSIDGFARTDEAEEKVNQACRAALNGPAGEALMDYLRSISTNVVVHHSASDQELRMLEGMRRLVGILDRRRLSTPQAAP